MRDSRLVYPAALFAVFAICLTLRSQSVQWDGIDYLMQMDMASGEFTDLFHALYVPLLRLGRPVWSALGYDDTFNAQALSAFSAGLYLVSLWAVLQAVGARPLVAGLLAAAATAAPTLMLSSVSVEVYTPANAFTVLSMAIVARYAASRRPGLLLLAFAAGVLAVGCHAFAFLALPAFWRLGRLAGRGMRVRNAVLILVLVLTLPALVVLLLGVLTDDLERYWDFVVQFLPLDSDPIEHWVRFGRSLWKTAVFLFNILPLTLLGLYGLKRGRDSHPEAVRLALWWILPYLLTFLVVGVSVWGLTLPLLPGLSILAYAGFEHLRERLPEARRKWLMPLLVVAVALHAGSALTRTARFSGTPDATLEKALAVERIVPEDCVVIAGSISRHLQYYTGVEIRSLVDIVPVYAPHQREWVMGVLRGIAREQHALGRKALLSSDCLPILGACLIFEVDLREMVVLAPPIQSDRPDVDIRLLTLLAE